MLSDIVVFPVPVQNKLNVKSEYPIVSVDIVSANGSVVFSNREVNESALDVNVAMLNAGFYFARIKTSQGRAVRKVLVLD